jgi:hypothetical protein
MSGPTVKDLNGLIVNKPTEATNEIVSFKRNPDSEPEHRGSGRNNVGRDHATDLAFSSKVIRAFDTDLDEISQRATDLVPKVFDTV